MAWIHAQKRTVWEIVYATQTEADLAAQRLEQEYRMIVNVARNSASGDYECYTLSVISEEEHSILCRCETCWHI